MMTRAEYRRQQKAYQKADRIYHFTAEKLSEYVDKAANKKALIVFRAEMKNYLECYMEIFGVAQLAALRKLFPHWGRKRNDRFIETVNANVEEINRIIHKSAYDPSDLQHWCYLNNIDPSHVFGLREKALKANPIETDDDGSPVVYLD